MSWSQKKPDGRVTTRAAGRGARAPFLFSFSTFALIYLLQWGGKGASSPRGGRGHLGAPRPRRGCRAGQGSAEPRPPPPPSPRRSEGTGGRRQRPGERGHRSPVPGSRAAPRPAAPAVPPAPRRRVPPAVALSRRRRPPPVLTAGRLGQRGDRGLAHGSSGEAVTPPAGRAASAAAVPGGPSRFSPRSSPAGGGRPLPRRLRAGGGRLSCCRAAGRRGTSAAASRPPSPRPGPGHRLAAGRGEGCALSVPRRGGGARESP